jgi:hypothetical protein
MKVKINSRLWVFLSVVVCVLLNWTVCQGKDLRRVCSEYRDVIDGSIGNTIKWQFVSTPQENGDVKISVMDVDRRVGAWVETFWRDGKLFQIKNYRQVRDEVQVDIGKNPAYDPFLADHCLLPVDWLNCPLPFDPERVPRRFKRSKIVGGSRFVFSYEVEIEKIAQGDALKAGWLNDANRKYFDGQGLYMVKINRVINNNSETVLKQLWELDGSFWLYEEKGRRCSWICE